MCSVDCHSQQLGTAQLSLVLLTGRVFVTHQLSSCIKVPLTLVIAFSLCRPRFDSGPVRVRYVVDKMTRGQYISSQHSMFPLSVSFHQYSILCFPLSVSYHQYSIFCFPLSVSFQQYSVFCFPLSVSFHQYSIFCFPLSVSFHQYSIFCFPLSVSFHQYSIFCFSLSVSFH